MSRRFDSPEGSTPRAGGTPPRLIARRAAAFAVGAAITAYLALDGGGYDILVRQWLGLGVWLAIAIGFAFGVLPRSRPPRVALVPLAAAGALLAWMLLSLTWTASDARTWAEICRLLALGGLAFAALVALNRHTFRAAAAGVSVAVLAVAALAVASRLFPETFTGATDVASQFRSDRLDFPLDYWNAVGAWGAMACAIGLAWSAHARSRLTRALSLAVVPVAGTAVYLSYSRGGVIGVAAALLGVLALSRNRWTVFVHALAALAGAGVAILVVRDNPAIAEATGSAGGSEVLLALAGAAVLAVGAVLVTSVLRADAARLTRDQARLGVAVAAVVALVFAASAGREPIADWWDEFRTEETPAAGADPASRLTAAGGNRNDIWTSAIDAFEAESLRGVGPGTFEFWWLSESNDPEYVRDAHSLYLEHAAELGLPGIALLLATLGGLAALALTGRRGLVRRGDFAASVAMTSAFAVFLVNAAVDWMWEETAVAAVAIGGIAIAGAGASSRRSRRSRRGTLLRPGGRAAVVAIAVAAALAQVPGIVSTQRLRASEAALADGDLAGARTLAEQSIDAQPWAAAPHAQLAIVEREAGDLDAAEEEIRAAIDREPSNWEWPLVLAPLQAAQGDRPAAVETFAEGRRLAPQLPFYAPFSVYAQQVYTPAQLERKFLRLQAERAAEAE